MMPSAHSNFPTMMVAEKASDMIKEDWGYLKNPKTTSEQPPSATNQTITSTNQGMGGETMDTSTSSDQGNTEDGPFVADNSSNPSQR